MEFERQSEIMDMKEEMMNDAIDDAMGDEDDEEERWETWNATFVRPTLYTIQNPVTELSCVFILSDAIVSQVLDELGLNLSDELSSKKTTIKTM